MVKQRKTGPAAITQVALAAAFEVSRKTVAQWCKRADWPVPRRAPWSWAHVHTIREWRKGLAKSPEREAAADAAAGQGSLESLAQNPERLAKLRLMLTRRELLELNRAIKAGEYVKLADVEAGRVARIQAVKEMLLQQHQRVAHQIRAVVKSAKTISKIKAIIDAENRRILRAFAGQTGTDDQAD